MSEGLQVSRNDALSRYEGQLAGEVVTTVEFVRRDDVVVITHTGTQPKARGRGLAAEITAAALADVRDHQWRVQAVCPFTVEYLDDHPEYDDLRR